MRFVYSLVFCLMCIHPAFAADRHESRLPGGNGNVRPQDAPAPSESNQQECSVSPHTLSSFANGEKYDLRAMVRFLTLPSCRGNSANLRMSALADGIDFTRTEKYRLGRFFPSIGSDGFDSPGRVGEKYSLETLQQVETALSTGVEPLLRQNPLTSRDGFPVVGQLAVLSPPAARKVMAGIIIQEMIQGQRAIESVSEREKPALAREMAKNAVRLGANQGPIMSELTDQVEDFAANAQSESLAKLLPALANVASVEAALVPIFNLSSSAVLRGVSRGKGLFEEEARAGLFQAIFYGIRGAAAVGGPLDPGASELAQALNQLLRGKKPPLAAMKALWRDMVGVLAGSPDYEGLAELISNSLTWKVVYLSKVDRNRLLSAARNYPVLASSVQFNFLEAWESLRSSLFAAEIAMPRFNQTKRAYFDPMVEQLLTLDPSLIEPNWLHMVNKTGLISDAEIEKRYPRFVVAYLDRQDAAARDVVTSPGFESEAAALTESLAVMWTLSKVHLPPLMKWVKKYETH